jgi:hypothetical protein
MIPERNHNSEEPPPFGGSWRYWYATVMGLLAVLVLLFTLFTEHYR